MDRFELATNIRKSGVSPVAQAVGACLVARWREDKQWATATATELSKEVGRSRKTVLRALDELQNAGLLRKQKTIRSSLYRAPILPRSNSEQDHLEETPVSTLNTHTQTGLHQSWQRHYPEFSHLTDAEFEAYCRDATNAAQLSDLTGWTAQECVDIHPDWVAAQLSTLALLKPDRSDGLNGTRILSLAHDWEINPQDKGESTKKVEVMIGHQRVSEETWVSTLNTLKANSIPRHQA